MIHPNATSRYVLPMVLVGHVVLMSLPSNEMAPTGLVRTVVLDLLTPVEMAFDFSVSGVRGIWTGYFDLVDVRRENENLRDEIDGLRMELHQNRIEINEAERLRALLALDPALEGERVVARVIAWGASLARQTVVIDKGTLHGLRVDVPIVTPDGVVGRVIQAGHISSIVQLITDSASAVGAIVETTRVQGIVIGDGVGGLRVEHVDDNALIEVGDELMTSGTDQIYPKGLYIGRIAALGPVADLMKTATVAPAVSLTRLEEVVCLIIPAASSQHGIQPLPDQPAP